ncbi:galactose-binding domain-like protein [Mycena metata]|uniref:Galactose-binding domain-like protein n=1 Tax=Mycena metata TaxID=1033252 RepID=A0AAD7NW15_9AGAR|nr:galactose-binding domain-like protein [Mycena metata]
MADNSESENSMASNLIGTDIANLYGFIDKDNVHGLNLAVPEDAKAIIKPWDERDSTLKYADSGVDDQIILHIPFVQNVRLKSILLKLEEGDSSPFHFNPTLTKGIGRGEVTPRHLRIYANHPDIVDFADAETTTPQLNISLLEGETGVIEYPFRVAAFTSITSLSLFFSDSVGGDVSRIYYVGFKGDAKSAQREASSKLEVPAANAADAPLVDRVSERASGQQTTAR